jgi:hypothetical protein
MEANNLTENARWGVIRPVIRTQKLSHFSKSFEVGE